MSKQTIIKTLFIDLRIMLRKFNNSRISFVDLIFEMAKI